jgi:hypothetical protein
MSPLELLVDDHHGQYMGQVLALTIKRELFPSISAEDWTVLESGPEHESYLDVCAELDQHSTEDGISLWWGEGGLWAIDWSHIGDLDDLQDIGDRACHELLSDPESYALFCDLRANLHGGPSCGRWSAELLAEMRERVGTIADKISAELPIYWSGHCGIEEHRPDVEVAMLQHSAGLREIAEYWH